MAISTNLNTGPYFDDYDQSKDFYRILFQPGVSVQVRELNQLQSILQKQFERFGDNIFSAGTIVSGCNFNFINPAPYIKIKDTDVTGAITTAYRYVNYNVRNETNGLTAWVTNYADGFEASNPNLKTLYLQYQDTGNPGVNAIAFEAGDILTVYDPVMNGIEKVNIINGSVGFSNTDVMLAISPLVVKITSGSITPGDYLLNEFGANVEVVAVDTTTLASSNQAIVTVAPRSVDLANVSANSMSWTLSFGQAVTNPAASMTAVINRVVGTGFVGSITTDGVGTVIATRIVNKGVGYIYDPYVTVRSVGNENGYNTLNLDAQNYVSKIVVSTAPSSVGNGYIFSISEGVIYQKGFFLRVQPQQIIVSKYDTVPDNLAVGFITNEQIINHNVDSSLLDNCNYTENFQGVGADRLKLIPRLQLQTATAASANAEFLTICAWKEGRPYKQNQSTIYSIIGDEMAKRTDDAAGDFIIDPFLVTTRSTVNTATEGQKFNIVIDPGSAYIQGYRVVTSANFNLDNDKGIETATVNTHTISINYGNYLTVNNVAGTFAFNLGDTVNLYDAASGFLANNAAIAGADLTPPGNIIGTANIRSLMHLDNKPGSSASVYKLYIFNLKMNTGKNFSDVRSVHYDGTNKGVADVVLSQDVTSGSNVAVIHDTSLDQLVFDAGVESLKNANNVSYSYRTLNQTVAISNGNIVNATMTFDISATTDEKFPYLGSLSDTELAELYVVPTSGELMTFAPGNGAAAVTTGSPNVVGNSQSTFLADFEAGDYIYVSANSSGNADLRQVVAVVNNTFMTINQAASFTNAAARAYRVYPQNVPVPFGYRDGLSANVNVNQNILTLDFGTTFTHSGDVDAVLGVNIKRTDVTQLTKTPTRNRFVKIQCSNNTATSVGPWCLGVPDVFRLRSVYVGNSSVNTSFTNYVNHFYVDHNQNADYYGLGYLYKSPDSNLEVGSGSFFLVEFDYFTATGAGFYDTVSYLHTSNSEQVFLQDSQPLSNTTTVAQSWEVPELFTDDGTEMDLLKHFDFRPYVANTVAPAALAGSAPVNPVETVTFSTTGEKKFPVPDGQFVADIEFYLGRKDSVFVDKNGEFSVLHGTASANPAKRVLPQQPDQTMKIIDLVIPPYPNLAQNYSLNVRDVLDTKVMNQKYLTTRIKNKTIHTPTSNTVLPYNQPKVYTMADIGNLDRRLHDVEYYTSLSVLESGISRQVILSSVDPTMDRFKFGFFVDDFTISSYCDLTNPQYAAMKEDEDIVPLKMNWDMTLFGGYPSHIDLLVIQQGIATVSKATDITGHPVCALNLSNTVAYMQQYRSSRDMNYFSQVDTVNLTFADEATVYESVNYVDTPINEWLQTHTYDIFKNLNVHQLAGSGGNSPQIESQLTSIFYGSKTIEEFVQRYNEWNVNGPVVWIDFANLRESTATPAWSNGVGPLGSNTNPVAGPLYASRPWWSGIGSGAVRVIDRSLQTYYGTSGGLSSTILPYREIAGSLGTILQSYYANTITRNSVPSGGQVVDTIYYPPVVLYFYNYDVSTKIEVFQNNVLIVDTTTTTNLTDEDKTLLTGPGAQYWFLDQTDLYMKDHVDQSNGYVTYAGKLNFNYNPANGNHFTIKTTTLNGTKPTWKWVMAYPINGDSIGCVPPTTYFDVPPTLEAQYRNVDLLAGWCGNAGPMFGSVSILSGFTETWNPVTVTPTTSIKPFDILSDWYGQRGTS